MPAGKQKGALYSFSTRIEHQIETYRYQSAELFRLANTTDTEKRPELVPPHKILNDIYWIDSRVPVVDAILFGQTNDETYAIARRFSDYLTILWGGENQFNSVYYLNGLDNSLLLVTSHSALRPELRYRESPLTLGADENGRKCWRIPQRWMSGKPSPPLPRCRQNQPTTIPTAQCLITPSADQRGGV